VRGRAFDERDGTRGAPVIIINQAMADRYWPDGADPLQDRIVIGGGADYAPAFADEPPREIVGIVADYTSRGLLGGAWPTMFVPQGQQPPGLTASIISLKPLNWIIRTDVDAASVSMAIQQEIQSATGLMVTRVRSMEDVLREASSYQRFNMLLMNAFAGAALLLATIGIYSLAAFGVQRRTKEIGIRMAIGAGFRDVRKMVLGEGLVIAVLGTGLGILASFFVANVLSSVLYEVEPHDPVVFVGVPVFLSLVALAAVSIPARRASRVDPMETLRYE